MSPWWGCPINLTFAEGTVNKSSIQCNNFSGVYFSSIFTKLNSVISFQSGVYLLTSFTLYYQYFFGYSMHSMINFLLNDVCNVGIQKHFHCYIVTMLSWILCFKFCRKRTQGSASLIHWPIKKTQARMRKKVIYRWSCLSLI